MSENIRTPPLSSTQGASQGASGTGSGLRLLHVGSRAPTVQDFIERYAPFAGDDWLRLPWAEGLARGTVGRFLIVLAAGRPVMRGRFQVLELIEPQGTNGREIRVRLLELDDASHDVHGRLIKRGREQLQGDATNARTAGSGLPPPAPGAGRPPPVPRAQPLLSLNEIFVSCVYEEDALTPTAEALDDTLDAGPLPHLTPPAVTIRQTGKFTGKTRVLVARRSRVPAILRPVFDPVAGAWASFLAALPAAQRLWLVRWLPLALTAVAFFAIGRCSKSDVDREGGSLSEAGSVQGGPGFPSTSESAAPAKASLGSASLPDETRSAEGPARCSATVETQPEGAEVRWGEVVLGKTPIAGRDVPCGRSLVSIAYPRYEPRVLTVTTMVGRELHLSETLKRPEAVVVLETTPSGAAILLGERQLGTTPGRLEVPRFEEIEITLTKLGFQPVTRRFMVENAEEAVKVTLKAESKMRPEPRDKERTRR